MPHRYMQAILAVLLAVHFFSFPSVHAEGIVLAPENNEVPVYEWTEGDALDELHAIFKLPECQDEKTMPCRKHMLHHFCKYSGTTFYTYACSGEKQLNAELPLNELTELDAIMSFPHCIDETSASCNDLKYHLSCKYIGRSSNAVVCAGGKQEEADNKLLNYYQSLLTAFRELASQDPHYKELPSLLAASQEAWSVYREKECKFVEQYFKGGALQSALWSDCMREKSEWRLQNLEKHAEEYSVTIKPHSNSLQRNASPQSGSRH